MHTLFSSKYPFKFGYAPVLVCAAFAAQSQSQEVQQPQVTDTVYTTPSQLVDMDHGRRMNIYCRGSGSPAVILDAGLGGDTTAWATVHPLIAAKTKACAFDRAGLGFSDRASRPNTVRNNAEDLHALLKAAKVPPPYVLVGHSSAGMNIRVFADRYPDEVVGMVAVDVSHEDQSTRLWPIGVAGQKEQWDAGLQDSETCVEHAKKGLVKGSPEYKKCIADIGVRDPRFSDAINDAQERMALTAHWQAAVASEQRAVYYASADETRATRKSFGSIPIIVLTHAPYPKAKDETQEERNVRTLLWETMHNEIAAMSTRGINIIVPNTGHYIQFDKPQVVVDAVNQALQIARDSLAQQPVPPKQ
jgi:pimeloyl-ACP methyl ester carboxylesterase